MYGILLDEIQTPSIKALFEQFKEAIESYLDGDDGDGRDSEGYRVLLVEWTAKFVAEFAALGAVVPTDVDLSYTGSDDDQPAQCQTAADQYILGYGIFKDPWTYPELDVTFRALAQHHTWVWMG
jgi:hypothetical protein